MAVKTKLEISKKEFKQRREKVLQYLVDLQYGDDRAENPKTIIYSGSEKIYSNDVHYPFRVNSDFYYLTGFEEPDSALVLDPNSKHPFTLYVRDKDPKREIWDGFRYGLAAAKKEFAADQCLDIKDVPAKPQADMNGSKDSSENPRFTHDAVPEGFVNVNSFIHKLRSSKSEAEIELMREANRIGMQAHRVARDIITPGLYEYEVQASIESVYRSQGARGWSYPPIIASGANSCILHYISNNEQIKDRSVVLIDAGCEYQYYASDITRVYAASGEFTQKQKDIYDLVLAAQEKAIESVKPGNTFGQTHELTCEVLAEGLADLGYIKNKNDQEGLRKYYMHGTGHSLGIDVHDLGVYDSRQGRQTAKYETGMVTTIEPGLYLAEHEIGIRLEDNILVTDKGYENLTADLPK